MSSGVCRCMHTDKCVYTCIHVYLCTYTDVHMFTSVYVYLHVNGICMWNVYVQDHICIIVSEHVPRWCVFE